jgi:hypothetical protein
MMLWQPPPHAAEARHALLLSAITMMSPLAAETRHAFRRP